MKIKEVRYETTDQGDHKVIEYTNGTKVKLLQKRSPAYQKRLDDEAVLREAAYQENLKLKEVEKLIKLQLREDAINKLKIKGILNEAGELIDEG